MSVKTLKSEVAAAAVATSGCGPEGVEVMEVTEGAEVEQAFARLERLYTQLRNSDLKVDAYADMNTLPDTPNVTVEEQN